jgi:hypothetical protein
LLTTLLALLKLHRHKVFEHVVWLWCRHNLASP